jgi:hypothetical protein
MNGDGSDLLEEMDYGDLNFLEEPSGEFSFDGSFDGEPQEFSNHSSGSNLFVAADNEASRNANGRGSVAAQQLQQQGLAQLLTNNANALGNREADRSSPRPQAWHSDEKDRDGRRRMIIEMYVLLGGRSESMSVRRNAEPTIFLTLFHRQQSAFSIYVSF